jgi:uncharacterized membrane protein YeaQ/YmgE (transglycosylase-associated protein family)
MFLIHPIGFFCALAGRQRSFMEMTLWVVCGLIGGSFAKLVMPGPNAGGIAVAIPVGIAGAFAGGLLISILPGGNLPSADTRRLVAAIAGTLFSLLIYRSFALRLPN